MFKPKSISCFSDPAAVRELASAGERLVCLEFPDGLGALYCHSFVLLSSSPVLRNALEDTQQQHGELCTIPLAGDSDVSVWSLALGLMYRVEAANITMDNAQGLLLLAHKYDMGRIIAELDDFLMTPTGPPVNSWWKSLFGIRTPPAAGTRLRFQLSPSTVIPWLQTGSKCGREQLVQLCIDYILTLPTYSMVRMPVPMCDMALLNSLDATHAEQLLVAMQHKLDQAYQEARWAKAELRAASGGLDEAVGALWRWCVQALDAVCRWLAHVLGEGARRT